MYKSKLQLLCQQRSWSLPDYSTAKNGPDHNPRFTATITVNGVPFETADQSRSAKDAQNRVAKLAYDHFSAPQPNPSPFRNRSPSPNPPQPSPVTVAPVPTSSSSSSGFPASITYSDTRPSIGGIMQPTKIKMAQTPLVNETCLGVKDDVRHLHKNRLQNYAQKRNLTLPEYSCEREGPPHASRFKSKVTIDGKIYESPEFFPTIKEAEHAAAKVAWESLSLNEVQEDDSSLYKNLLQELAQKEGFQVPKYETSVSGPPHIPTFVSTVEIGGQSFQGQAAKSKKQAEMNAAKVAYNGLQERNKTSLIPTVLPSGSQIKKALEDSPSISGNKASLMPAVLPSGCQIKKALEDSSSILQSVITGDLQQTARPTTNLVNHEEQDNEYIENAEVSTRYAPVPDANINAKRYKSSASSDFIYASLRDPFPSTSSSPEDCASSPSRSEYCTNSSMDSINEPPVGASGTNPLPHENILVYPRAPNMKFPGGATVLPFSDDKWVALKMDSNQE